MRKKLRFEVLKRDSFKCQYCGAEAPDVLLHVDHIKPKSKGGKDDLTNLVTSCAGCNHGKGATELSDDSAVKKSRDQAAELQERREQLEMMMEWREGLHDLDEEAVDRAAEYWERLAPGYCPNDNGRRHLRKWIRKFGLQEILSSMDEAADALLEFMDDGNVTKESWSAAFDKLPGFTVVRSHERDCPDIRSLYYARGILRKRLSWVDEGKAFAIIKAAYDRGVSADTIIGIARDAGSWTSWEAEMEFEGPA